MIRENCPILDNKKVAPGHYVVKIRSGRISRNAKPGQFVQISLGDGTDPFLPRPFSFFDADGRDFSILYHVVGKGTEILSRMKKGEHLKVLGSLGKGFSMGPVRKDVILVGGGVGIPPLYFLAKTLLKLKKTKRPENIKVILGARDKSLLLCERDFKKLGIDLLITTDNGSKGKKGFVTEILDTILSNATSLLRSPHGTTFGGERFVYACGPTPMLKGVSALCEKYGVDGEVSLETMMACGFGACLGCAVKIKVDSRQLTASSLQQKKKESISAGHLQAASCQLPAQFWYAMACKEGPVFRASEVVWE